MPNAYSNVVHHTSTLSPVNYHMGGMTKYSPQHSPMYNEIMSPSYDTSDHNSNNLPIKLEPLYPTHYQQQMSHPMQDSRSPSVDGEDPNGMTEHEANHNRPTVVSMSS